jgi:hypothetical protein
MLVSASSCRAGTIDASQRSMLVQIGQRLPVTDVVDLLYECHRRIRYFLELPHLLASSSRIEESEVRSIAASVVRYFTGAFPLHIADEHESIAPRLAGRNGSLDAALTRMQADHEEHAQLDRLITICRDLAGHPRQLAAHAALLAETTEQVTLQLEAHLVLEELTIFPALRELPAAERAAIHDEMRMRRGVSTR